MKAQSSKRALSTHALLRRLRCANTPANYYREDPAHQAHLKYVNYMRDPAYYARADPIFFLSNFVSEVFMRLG